MGKHTRILAAAVTADGGRRRRASLSLASTAVPSTW
jgi:hypothetical protein